MKIEINCSQEISNKKRELEKQIKELLQNFNIDVCPIDKVNIDILKHYRSTIYQNSMFDVSIKLFL